MGLDMYLKKKIYIGANYEHNNVTGKISLKKDGKPIAVNLSKVTYIEEQAGYWRKANQIHNWFVKNVQGGVDNCGEYYVSEEQLTELLSLCKKVKESTILKEGAVTDGYTWENGVKMPIVKEGKEIVNPEVAQKILPVKSGFFFGSTDYDEYYMSDIDNTIEILESVLSDKEPGKDYLSADYYYHSSW